MNKSFVLNCDILHHFEKSRGLFHTIFTSDIRHSIVDSVTLWMFSKQVWFWNSDRWCEITVQCCGIGKSWPLTSSRSTLWSLYGCFCMADELWQLLLFHHFCFPMQRVDKVLKVQQRCWIPRCFLIETLYIDRATIGVPKSDIKMGGHLVALLRNPNLRTPPPPGQCSKNDNFGLVT